MSFIVLQVQFCCRLMKMEVGLVAFADQLNAVVGFCLSNEKNISMCVNV